jgi:hypothetical protein
VMPSVSEFHKKKIKFFDFFFTEHEFLQVIQGEFFFKFPQRKNI